MQRAEGRQYEEDNEANAQLNPGPEERAKILERVEEQVFANGIGLRV